MCIRDRYQRRVHGANKLVDYDLAQNNGGWQWSASTGVDSQPYFRIFNPKLQSEKFDKDCEYILKWVPELKGVSKADVHDWEARHKTHRARGINYPEPIIIHQVQKEKAIALFKAYGPGEKAEEETDDSSGKRSKSKPKNTGKRRSGDRPTLEAFLSSKRSKVNGK
eukprot:TRINITY_DN3615_c0_g1_i9.p1 TRINITY_DN3615_c0_g1~~TRINITY_DN3615_c0_g1_i9.p1  ORF type:complete len:186 (+),score=39.09 TRINITY_DN3615_c0_g1_i9:61-558(+)